MTKAEFLAERQRQREMGLLKPLESSPKDNFQEEFQLTEEEEDVLLKALRSQTVATFRLEQVPEAKHLLINEVYTGKEIEARRRKVDELNNITVWRKKD